MNIQPLALDSWLYIQYNTTAHVVNTTTYVGNEMSYSTERSLQMKTDGFDKTQKVRKKVD